MSNEDAEKNKDYFINYTLDNSGKAISIYLPFNDDYLPIAEAIIKVCSLFGDILNNKEAKDCTEEKKMVKRNGVVLVVCNKDERAKMIKHPDCFWVETEELTLEHLIDPATNAELFSNIVNEVYEKLMKDLSH